MSSTQPIYGNQFFTRVRTLATTELQRVKADDVVATTLTVSLTSVAPTGPTGPYGNAVTPGHLVIAATGPLGAGPVIGFYTGAKWSYTSALIN
jgi:hypothetical protein